MKILVTGSSGFIGGHLVRRLKKQGHYVVGADIERPRYSDPSNTPDRFYRSDLRHGLSCVQIFHESDGFDEVYNLACLMGGMGYIGDSKHSFDIMTGSSLIVANILQQCVNWKVKKLFYSSSACVYNMDKQGQANSPALKEADAYPAMPDLMYGWQKLSSELMHQSAYEQHGLEVRVSRFHNIFGTEGVWSGGKEKAPAAICRKVAMADDGDTIDIWGDGKQARSFLYIDECLDGVERLMDSDHREPINIGSDEMITIDGLANMVIDISGKNIKIKHDLTKPQGVRGRNSDNTKIEKVLGWKPILPLRFGMEELYFWINSQINGNV